MKRNIEHRKVVAAAIALGVLWLLFNIDPRVRARSFELFTNDVVDEYGFASSARARSNRHPTSRIVSFRGMKWDSRTFLVTGTPGDAIATLDGFYDSSSNGGGDVAEEFEELRLIVEAIRDNQREPTAVHPIQHYTLYPDMVVRTYGSLDVSNESAVLVVIASARRNGDSSLSLLRLLNKESLYKLAHEPDTQRIREELHGWLPVLPGSRISDRVGHKTIGVNSATYFLENRVTAPEAAGYYSSAMPGLETFRQHSPEGSVFQALRSGKARATLIHTDGIRPGISNTIIKVEEGDGKW
jgi:hypothetical protein